MAGFPPGSSKPEGVEPSICSAAKAALSKLIIGVPSPINGVKNFLALSGAFMFELMQDMGITRTLGRAGARERPKRLGTTLQSTQSSANIVSEEENVLLLPPSESTFYLGG